MNQNQLAILEGNWRSDATEAKGLGEEVAILFLRQEHQCFNEDNDGASFTRFDGTRIAV